MQIKWSQICYVEGCFHVLEAEALVDVHAGFVDDIEAPENIGNTEEGDLELADCTGHYFELAECTGEYNSAEDGTEDESETWDAVSKSCTISQCKSSGP